VQLVDFLFQFNEFGLGTFKVLNRFVIVLLVMMCKTEVVVKIVYFDLVIAHGCLDALKIVAELLEDVNEIAMGSFVTFVLFDSFEVPLHSDLVIFEKLVIYSDVVVTRGILRSHLAGLPVPFDCLLVLLQGPAVDDPDLIEGSRVVRMQIGHFL
jgi:hypothetical protein